MSVSPELVPALLPLLPGLVLLGNGITRWRRWHVGADWGKTSATVRVATTASAPLLMGVASRAGSYRYPHIAYTYVVDGYEYTAVLQQALAGAERRRQGYAYRAGMRFDVYFDPRAPERSVPEGHVEWSAPVSLVLGVALLVLTGGLVWSVTAH